jgi:predicted RNase H-like HicB family nuclease
VNILDYPISIRPLSKEEGSGFLAIAPDLPDCMSDGETQEEAIKNLHEAMEAWFDEARALGREIPDPTPVARTA